MAAPPDAGEVARLPGSLERVVLVDLEACERVETLAGQMALMVARTLDGGAGAQMSALMDRLSKLVVAAKDGVAPPADFVDDMAARRQRRRGA